LVRSQVPLTHLASRKADTGAATAAAAAASTGFAGGGGGGGASMALTADPLDAAVGVGCSASGSLGGATSTGASPAAARPRQVPRRPAWRRGKGRRCRWRCV
jgi:hypothetical protein